MEPSPPEKFVIEKLKVKCIDDTIGPSERFLIENQTQAQTIQQAFALYDVSEEIGLDFENFYDFFKVIYGVKQFGKTTYGTLTFDVPYFTLGIQRIDHLRRHVESTTRRLYEQLLHHDRRVPKRIQFHTRK